MWSWPAKEKVHIISTSWNSPSCNRTGRFSSAIDAIDRMPRFCVTGYRVRAASLNRQIDCKNHV